jgi:hypothetical protein
MSNKRNFFSPLKIGILSLLFILNNYAAATTYYVDATNGSDNNSGTSVSQAWQTINKVESKSFLAGDVISFKRGEIWYDRLDWKDSGISGNPITLNAYGIGEKPIISGFGELSGTWTNEGGNKWSLSTSIEVDRLFMDGEEQKRTSEPAFGHTWDEFGGVAGAVWIWDAGKIYYYSEANPSSHTFEGNLKNSSMYSNGVSYVIVDGIEFYGAPVKMYSSSYVTVKNCTIGKRSGEGISFNSSNHIILENNTIDSDCTLKYTGFDSYTGTDYRGIGDGANAYGAGLINSEIRNNDFINWGHSAINLEAGTVTNVKIHHNYFTSRDLVYGRAMAISGDGVTENEIYNNYFHNLNIRSQIMGKNNHIHHNWFDGAKDTPMKRGEQGQAIALEAYNGNPTGNLFEYNTIANTEGPGIELVASGKSSDDISGNTFKKNLFINCGTNPYYSWGVGKGIAIQQYVDIRANNFYDNAFTSTLTSDTVYHRQAQVSPEEFNSRNGIGGDDISGNTSTVTDQGAGDMSAHNIGVGAVQTVSPTEEPKTGAFIMDRSGLH